MAADRDVAAHPRAAVAALLIAGFGWGTTGLFVRSLGAYGLSPYELLVVRLAVTGIAITPILLFSLRTNPRRLSFKVLAFFGFSMALYYFGAITAFHHLPMVIAALIIGSSPLVAWLIPILQSRRVPVGGERRQGIGVALAMTGLLILLAAKGPALKQGVSGDAGSEFLGYLGAIFAALVTVVNARILNRMGPKAPKPFEITIATVLVGLMMSPFFILNPRSILQIAVDHAWLTIGFGILATAIPGIAIAFASVRLPPQATATVSIQLQVWAGALAWIILGESLSPVQVVAATFVVLGTWICVRSSS
ncbi:EamA family transporter [soil metagenome]